MRTSRRILSGHRLQGIDCRVVGKFGEGKIGVIKWILNYHFGGE